MIAGIVRAGDSLPIDPLRFSPSIAICPFIIQLINTITILPSACAVGSMSHSLCLCLSLSHPSLYLSIYLSVCLSLSTKPTSLLCVGLFGLLSLSSQRREGNKSIGQHTEERWAFFFHQVNRFLGPWEPRPQVPLIMVHASTIRYWARYTEPSIHCHGVVRYLGLVPSR